MFAVVGMVKAAEEETGQPFDWGEYAKRGRFESTQWCSTVVQGQEELADALDVHRNYITYALQAVREAPDVADQVLAGTIGIRLAREKVATRRQEKEEGERILATLAIEAPDLAQQHVPETVPHPYATSASSFAHLHLRFVCAVSHCGGAVGAEVSEAKVSVVSPIVWWHLVALSGVANAWQIVIHKGAPVW